MGGEVQLLNWWQLRKLVARSAMGCAKLVIPETGFVGEEKFCLSLCAPGAGMTGKISEIKVKSRGLSL